jgi:pyruvate/2-oxoglutarate dehydrogenase complex dihydrolipoamide dehydrogenase (E3) component
VTRNRHRNDALDVIVVGGGAGGLTAATHAARRGARTALVADGPLGGECTHTGCVPSKTLLAAAAAGRSFDEAMRDVHDVIDRVAATEDEAALGRAGVSVIRGRAVLEDRGAVRVDGRALRAADIVLATGSTASVPPIDGLTEVGALTNETVFDLTVLPRRLAIIGGGPVGCELAQAFARLGSDVTLLEGAERILPGEDPAVSAAIAAALSTDGVDVLAGARIEAVERRGDQRCLRIAERPTVEADQVLVATGRRPMSSGLGLESVGVETDRAGHVVVAATCATSVDGIWAVGDMTQHGGFTHVAGNMGFVAAVNATRRYRLRPLLRIERRAIPRVLYTDPEVAQIGLTEAQAAEVGGRVAEVSLEHVDRALTSRRTDGFVKLIAGPRPVLGSLGGGQILGATIVAPRAGELVAEVALAMKTRMFTGRLAQTMHPYPTWSMALQRAATQFFFPTDGQEARPARS